MLNTAVAEKKYTYQDYLKTPDDIRYELVEGELLMTPAPNTEHQRISRKLEFKLAKFVEDNDLGEVFDAPCDVYLDEENCLQPDILFIAKDRLNIIGKNNIQDAPDLVVEIISESSVYRDSVRKKKLYAKFGVKEFWLVAPEEKMIEVYNLDNQRYRLSQTCFYNDSLESQVLKGFRMDSKDIF
ncbi:MAG: Uma2 family endonuclease [Candidatus Schekmanbacteria bacterium]|nr:Uma2 family endonuclease [Candidatus Schekmanbacteria bacterium]